MPYKMQKKNQSSKNTHLHSVLLLFENTATTSLPAHTQHATSVFCFFFLFLPIPERTLCQQPSANRAWVNSLGSPKAPARRKPGCLAQYPYSCSFAISLPNRGMCKWEDDQSWALGNKLYRGVVKIIERSEKRCGVGRFQRRRT